MSSSASNVSDLPGLIAAHRPGFSLAQVFYERQDIFEAELDSFIAPHWIVAGHASEIPERGDYLVVEVAGNSIIVVRGEEGRVFALQNVCRHRGARICEDSKGHVALFRCRYHGWSYRLDGKLAAWRHMSDELSKDDFGLQACGVAQFAGIILISLRPDAAPDFSALAAHLEPHFARYELQNCKVIATETFRVAANWKLGVENNLECYHCLPSHPQYTAANAFVKADERVSERHVEEFAAYSQQWRGRMTQLGVPVGRSNFIAVGGQLCRAGTFPLSPGQLTGSESGQGVAPLLGSLSSYDESITSGCFGFLSYVAAMCDYALLVTYIPRGVDVTDVTLKFLVRSDAVEGTDYDVDKVRWLWTETTRQDKSIIELNARGVATRGYQPGPYSELEKITADFVARYLQLLR